MTSIPLYEKHLRSIILFGPPGSGKGTLGDSHKPQFIDFTSPLLVSLFVRVGPLAPGTRVFIEESYPDISHLATAENGRYVTELILQLDYHLPPAVCRGSGSVEAVAFEI